MFKQTIIGGAVVALLLMAGSAIASGFALIEQSGSGLGNAFAGGAASAEDASTIFYNPAGMSRLSGRQLVVAGNEIRPSAKFTGTGGVGGNTGGDAGSWALVPNAYFAMEVNPKTRIGLGINAPFGLQTEYAPNWMGRAQAIKSKLETVNLNPSVAYQLNDALSVGAGVNYQRIRGELTSFAGAAGTGSVTGSDAAWGYNLGMLYNVTSNARIGVAYRSSISYNLSGGVTFSALPVLNSPATLAIKMPDSLSFSGFHQLSDHWDFMADATWTGWSVFQQLNVMKAGGVPLGLATPENWKDTWRVSTGANYHYNETWTARAGVAFDQSPVADQFRTVRIPDGDRTWLSVGGQYKPNKQDALDFGYAHLFVKNASLNQSATANPDLLGKGYLTGNYSNSVDILSVQYAHSF
jgi:long-chain fatty acid transport protein